MTNYAVQEQNQDLVSLLAAYFRLLYNPTHAFSDAIGMLQMFPGLVAAWPTSWVGSSVSNTDALGDLRSRFHLSNNNAVTTGGSGLTPFASLNGSNQYYSHSDQAALRITGGLTLGGWFLFDNVAVAAEAMIYKVDNTNNSYYLQRRSTGNFQFGIYNSNSPFTVNSTTVVGAGGWVFVAGRFEPSTRLKVWVNGSTNTNTTSIPASIDADTSIFTIGASGAPGSYMDGRFSLAFLCAAAVNDVTIATYYQMTAPLFGVSI